MLNNAFAHYNYAVTHCHCFALVMGYIYNGNAQFLLNGQNFKTHAFTKLSVQVGQRFVEKQEAGLSNESTSQSYTLLLTTGKLVGITFAVFTEVNQFQHFLNAFSTFFFSYLLNFQRIANVFSNGHMGPNCIGLEYHTDVTFFRGSEGSFNGRAYAFIADINFTFSCTFKACNHTQGSSFTATGRTEDGDKFAIFYNYIKIVYGSYSAETFIYMFNSYLCH